MRQAVLDIRPTQLSLGMREVHYRVKLIRQMKSSELDDYLHERRVPLVQGPRGRLYNVDHHHLLRACWEAGVEKVPVEIKADLSHLEMPQMWKAMREANWLFLFDQFGGGPHEPFDLPEDIRGLADDPYRSVAWRLRREGAFDKVAEPFFEFAWAAFLRKELKTHPVHGHFEDAVQEALKLAKSPAARRLPGFKG